MSTSLYLGTERRKSARTIAEAIIYISVEPNNGGVVSNISEGGLCFHLAGPVQLIDALRFCCLLKGRRIQIDGKLAWTNDTKKKVACNSIPCLQKCTNNSATGHINLQPYPSPRSRHRPHRKRRDFALSLRRNRAEVLRLLVLFPFERLCSRKSGTPIARVLSWFLCWTCHRGSPTGCIFWGRTIQYKIDGPTRIASTQPDVISTFATPIGSSETRRSVSAGEARASCDTYCGTTSGSQRICQ